MSKVVALAGGVGGAKLAWGLAQILTKDELAIIVNTGDDFEHFGLSISPDLDTVCYTLGGVANPVTGWGRQNETWNCLDELRKFDDKCWFNLGDRDLAWHLERTKQLREGKSLTEVTAHLCKKLKIDHAIIPMSDQPVKTIVETREYGNLPFQEYFVKNQCKPTMINCRFDGIENAMLPEKANDALKSSELVIICPSNPWVSIDPILNVMGVRELLKQKIVIAVSPIIGGKTVKGPAAKMYEEMGIEPSALAVARHYQGIATGMIIDSIDKSLAQSINQCGIIPMDTQTIMSDNQIRVTLARETMYFADHLKKV
jgi:LPPG:FO 2-phospho-L-lactate transferase